MDLESFKDSISSMSDEEILARLQEIRASRRKRPDVKPTQKKKAQSKSSAMKTISKLSKEEMEQLLKELS